MKKILFITHENPFTYDSGDRRYSADIISVLIELGYSIELVCFEAESKEYVRDTNVNITFVPFKKKSMIKLALSFYPGMIANRYSSEMRKAVKKIISENTFTDIIISHFKMSYLIKDIIQYIGKGVNTILITHNIEYLVDISIAQAAKNYVLKIIYYIDALKTKLFEKLFSSKFDVITCISDYDIDYFRNKYKLKKIYKLSPYVLVKEVSPHESGTNIIVGSFNWVAKKYNLLKLVQAKNISLLKENKIKVLVVGDAEPKFIKYINGLDANVEMLGYVGSLKKYYQNASICIIPEKVGGGFKMKLLEAANECKAIIAVKEAITDDIWVKDKHYVEVSTYEELINKLVLMNVDMGLTKEVAQNSHSLCKNRYNKDVVVSELKSILNSQ